MLARLKPAYIGIHDYVSNRVFDDTRPLSTADAARLKARVLATQKKPARVGAKGAKISTAKQ